MPTLRGKSLLIEATESATENSVYDVVFDIQRHNDGGRGRLHMVGKDTLDESGLHQAFFGVLQEITASR
jgi:hypothetical protein